MSRKTGVGLSYRREFQRFFVDLEPHVDFWELIAEDFPGDARAHERELAILKAKAAPQIHSTALSLGSVDRTADLVEKEREMIALAAAAGASIVSEHLCYTEAGDIAVSNFLPVSRTKAGLEAFIANIARITPKLGSTLAIENVTSYLTLPGDEIDDAAFLTQLTERTQSELLIDVSNLFINSVHRGEDPLAFLEALPAKRVASFHVAGYSEVDGWLIDSHDRDLDPQVLDLLAAAVRIIGPRPIILERDTGVDGPEELVADLAKIRKAAGL